MVGLANALAANGHCVTYVANGLMNSRRSQQGWSVPDTSGVGIEILKNEGDLGRYMRCFPDDAVHLMQGIRSDTFLTRARAEL